MLHLSITPDLRSEQAKQREYVLNDAKNKVTSFGGSYLIRMGDVHALDSELDDDPTSLIELPPIAALQAFYAANEAAHYLSEADRVPLSP